MIALNFGLNYSYAERIIVKTVGKTSTVLAEQFVQWIGVIDRISKYEVYNEDWPTIIGSLDTTVQLISRPKENQEEFYSGKHKFHCIKKQALVSPTGLMIHSSQSVNSAMHDFQLYKISNLE